MHLFLIICGFHNVNLPTYSSVFVTSKQILMALSHSFVDTDKVVKNFILMHTFQSQVEQGHAAPSCFRQLSHGKLVSLQSLFSPTSFASLLFVGDFTISNVVLKCCLVVPTTRRL